MDLSEGCHSQREHENRIPFPTSPSATCQSGYSSVFCYTPSNKRANYMKLFHEFCVHFSKLIEPEEGGVGTLDLQPVHQKGR
jgi:hypothetical protein